MYKIQKKMWLVIAALAVLVTVFAPASEASCRKVVVQMDESFVVDGQLFPAGGLSLCPVREFSPVATLNEVRVDGRSLGVLMAHDGRDTAPSKQNQMIFERDVRGHLVLVSIALQGGPVRQLYRLANQRNGWQQLAAEKRQDNLVASVK